MLILLKKCLSLVLAFQFIFTGPAGVHWLSSTEARADEPPPASVPYLTKTHRYKVTLRDGVEIVANYRCHVYQDHVETMSAIDNLVYEDGRPHTSSIDIVALLSGAKTAPVKTALPELPDLNTWTQYEGKLNGDRIFLALNGAQHSLNDSTQAADLIALLDSACDVPGGAPTTAMVAQSTGTATGLSFGSFSRSFHYDWSDFLVSVTGCTEQTPATCMNEEGVSCVLTNPTVCFTGDGQMITLAGAPGQPGGLELPGFEGLGSWAILGEKGLLDPEATIKPIPGHTEQGAVVDCNKLNVTDAPPNLPFSVPGFTGPSWWELAEQDRYSLALLNSTLQILAKYLYNFGIPSAYADGITWAMQPDHGWKHRLDLVKDGIRRMQQDFTVELVETYLQSIAALYLKIESSDGVAEIYKDQSWYGCYANYQARPLPEVYRRPEEQNAAKGTPGLATQAVQFVTALFSNGKKTPDLKITNASGVGLCVGFINSDENNGPPPVSFNDPAFIPRLSDGGSLVIPFERFVTGKIGVGIYTCDAYNPTLLRTVSYRTVDLGHHAPSNFGSPPASGGSPVDPSAPVSAQNVTACAEGLASSVDSCGLPSCSCPKGQHMEILDRATNAPVTGQGTSSLDAKVYSIQLNNRSQRGMSTLGCMGQSIKSRIQRFGNEFGFSTPSDPLAGGKPVCVPNTCSGGAVLQSDGESCACASNQQWNRQTGSCEPKPPEPPGGGDGCPVNTELLTLHQPEFRPERPSDNGCVCEAESEVMTDAGCKNACSEEASGKTGLAPYTDPVAYQYTMNPDSGLNEVTVEVSCACPNGTIMRENPPPGGKPGCVAPPQCGATQYFNPSTWNCTDKCNADTENLAQDPDPNKWSCSCKAGRYRSAQTGVCEPIPPCAEHQYFNQQQGACVDKCPANSTYNNGSCTCNQGFYTEGLACDPIPECAADEYWFLNGSESHCKKKCDVGTWMPGANGGYCLISVSCPAGHFSVTEQGCCKNGSTWSEMAGTCLNSCGGPTPGPSSSPTYSPSSGPSTSPSPSTCPSATPTPKVTSTSTPQTSNGSPGNVPASGGSVTDTPKSQEAPPSNFSDSTTVREWDVTTPPDSAQAGPAQTGNPDLQNIPTGAGTTGQPPSGGSSGGGSGGAGGQVQPGFIPPSQLRKQLPGNRVNPSVAQAESAQIDLLEAALHSATATFWQKLDEGLGTQVTQNSFIRIVPPWGEPVVDTEVDQAFLALTHSASQYIHAVMNARSLSNTQKTAHLDEMKTFLDQQIALVVARHELTQSQKDGMRQVLQGSKYAIEAALLICTAGATGAVPLMRTLLRYAGAGAVFSGGTESATVLISNFVNAVATSNGTLETVDEFLRRMETWANNGGRAHLMSTMALGGAHFAETAGLFMLSGRLLGEITNKIELSQVGAEFALNIYLTVEGSVALSTKLKLVLDKSRELATAAKATPPDPAAIAQLEEEFRTLLVSFSVDAGFMSGMLSHTKVKGSEFFNVARQQPTKPANMGDTPGRSGRSGLKNPSLGSAELKSLGDAYLKLDIASTAQQSAFKAQVAEVLQKSGWSSQAISELLTLQTETIATLFQNPSWSFLAEIANSPSTFSVQAWKRFIQDMRTKEAQNTHAERVVQIQQQLGESFPQDFEIPAPRPEIEGPTRSYNVDFPTSKWVGNRPQYDSFSQLMRMFANEVNHSATNTGLGNPREVLRLLEFLGSQRKTWEKENVDSAIDPVTGEEAATTKQMGTPKWGDIAASTYGAWDFFGTDMTNGEVGLLTDVSFNVRSQFQASTTDGRWELFQKSFAAFDASAASQTVHAVELNDLLTHLRDRTGNHFRNTFLLFLNHLTGNARSITHVSAAFTSPQGSHPSFTTNTLFKVEIASRLPGGSPAVKHVLLNRVPGRSFEEMTAVMNAVVGHLQNAKAATSTEVKKSEIMRSMHLYFTTYPFYRGTAAIGRGFFTGMINSILGGRFRLHRDVDILALSMGEEEFVNSVNEVIFPVPAGP